MSVLRRIPISFLKVLCIALAVGLAFWQYDLVANRVKPTTKTMAPVELQFRMNDGRTVVVPEDTSKFSVVMFWSTSSERSISMIQEVVEARQSPELDSVFDFYVVNIEDSPEEMRQEIDFDNPQLPFGFEPSGQFLSKSPVRTLPLTVVFSSTGSVFAGYEGYSPGELTAKLQMVASARKLLGSSGEFKFRVE